MAAASCPHSLDAVDWSVLIVGVRLDFLDLNPSLVTPLVAELRNILQQAGQVLGRKGRAASEEVRGFFQRS